jgi:hypothetical protein
MTFQIGISILLGFYSMQMINELFSYLAQKMQADKPGTDRDEDYQPLFSSDSV